MSQFSDFNVIEYKYIQLIVLIVFIFLFDCKKIQLDTKQKRNKRRILSTV